MELYDMGVSSKNENVRVQKKRKMFLVRMLEIPVATTLADNTGLLRPHQTPHDHEKSLHRIDLV